MNEKEREQVRQQSDRTIEDRQHATDVAAEAEYGARRAAGGLRTQDDADRYNRMRYHEDKRGNFAPLPNDPFQIHPEWDENHRRRVAEEARDAMRERERAQADREHQLAEHERQHAELEARRKAESDSQQTTPYRTFLEYPLTEEEERFKREHLDRAQDMYNKGKRW